jgi:hypothetical protein
LATTQRAIPFYFNTFDSNDPSASVTMTNFINTDVHIHKDDGLTQRNNAAGITVDVDVDGIAGCHLIKIDTSDNTVADFFVPGADYGVRIEGVTVDAATLNPFVGHFSLENRHVAGSMVKTTIATLASQTSFTLTAGSADDDAYNNCIAIITDIASAVQKAVGRISDYTGATKTVTLAADPGIFTMAAKDRIHIIATAALANVDSWIGTAVTLGSGAPDVNVASEDNIDFGATKKASINTEADTALTDYDPPTKAEMDTAHALLATVAKQDVIDGIVDNILVDTGTTLDNHLTDIKGTGFVKDTHSLIDIETYVDLVDDGTSGLAKIATDVAAILVDTGTTLDARIPAALVGGKMNADATSISGSAAAADRIEAWLGGFLTGAVEEGGGPTTTVFQTDAAEATDDHFNNAIIVFTGGNLLGQARRISDYTGATGTMTVEPALTEAPAAADTWIIFPMVIGGIDSAGRVDVGRILGTAQTAGDVTADTAAILVDTNELQTDDVPGLIAALNDISAADVNTQVLDVLATDTFAESAGVPAATATLVAKIGWLATLARNKITQTANTQTLRNDADGADVATAAVSDDGTTATRAEWA